MENLINDTIAQINADRERNVRNRARALVESIINEQEAIKKHQANTVACQTELKSLSYTEVNAAEVIGQ